MAALRQSPSITARCSCSKSGTLNPSTRQTVPGRATRSSARAQRVEVGDVQPAGVDAAHAARDDGRAGRGAQHERVELLRAPRVCCLESLRRRARAGRRASAARGRTARPRPRAGPASEPRPASSAPATQRQPRSRSNANSLRPLSARRRLRPGCRALGLALDGSAMARCRRCPRPHVATTIGRARRSGSRVG